MTGSVRVVVGRRCPVLVTEGLPGAVVLAPVWPPWQRNGQTPVPAPKRVPGPAAARRGLVLQGYPGPGPAKGSRDPFGEG